MKNTNLLYQARAYVSAVPMKSLSMRLLREEAITIVERYFLTVSEGNLDDYAEEYLWSTDFRDIFEAMVETFEELVNTAGFDQDSLFAVWKEQDEIHGGALSVNSTVSEYMNKMLN